LIDQVLYLFYDVLGDELGMSFFHFLLILLVKLFFF
jgi:hypothetical protein